MIHIGFGGGFFFKLLGRQKDFMYFCSTFTDAPVVQWIEYRIPVPTIWVRFSSGVLCVVVKCLVISGLTTFLFRFWHDFGVMYLIECKLQSIFWKGFGRIYQNFNRNLYSLKEFSVDWQNVYFMIWYDTLMMVVRHFVVFVALMMICWRK